LAQKETLIPGTNSKLYPNVDCRYYGKYGHFKDKFPELLDRTVTQEANQILQVGVYYYQAGHHITLEQHELEILMEVVFENDSIDDDSYDS